MAVLAPFLPALTAIGSIASAGVSIAGAAGGGKEKAPPTESSAQVEESRKRLLKARAGQAGRKSTILAGASQANPTTQKATLLGGQGPPT